MKKRIIKKLSLSKETVANLEAQDLKVVKGGYETGHCNTGDYCTSGCPTRYC